jgi:hypothetical protein
MVPSRRDALAAAGTGAAAALAGCLDALGGDDGRELTLTLYRQDRSLVESVPYEPGDDALFGDPARAALSAVVPGGTHDTVGYRPVPEDEYVARDGRYYQIAVTVTGRRRVERPLVTGERVDETPDDAVTTEDLPRAGGRVAKILYTHAVTDGQGGPEEGMRGDAYVLRRPAELADGLPERLDGLTVRIGDDPGAAGVTLAVERRTLVEPVYTTRALPVADSPEEFRSVLLATHVDAVLARERLPEGAREVLVQATADGYAETAPPSDGYATLLDRLGFAEPYETANGRTLLLDDEPYRYGLYVNDVD